MRIKIFGCCALCASVFLWSSLSSLALAENAAGSGAKGTVRLGAAQLKSRLIDYRLTNAIEVLAQVDKSLGELEQVVHKAGALHCDAVGLPEDTSGLGKWEAGHKEALGAVLAPAVSRMLDRLGAAAASHRMFLICCNDAIEPDGSVCNTAFFLGRDGREIGRYRKVNMPIHELDKKRGDRFPVFPTPELGGVGLLICYDMVFPEAARCLALAGADVIFHPTLGGAAVGDDDISRAAFRTRAVENFVYLVVAQRGAGSMIISPQGKILAEGHGPDDIVFADIDPFGGREGGDSMNHQTWIDRVAGERLASLPKPLSGLAARYPGDVGLERDPHVLFAENFETVSIDEIGKRWGEISDHENKVMILSDDVPPGSAGKRSLQLTATLGQNTGGHLYTRLPKGADKVFARFYVKFGADAAYIHHFVTLGGYNPPSPWPKGTAGERPRGDDHFTVGIEPYGDYGRFPPPGAWNFYAYWPEMKGSADGRYWGNGLTPVHPALVPRERWQCVEVMVRCNSAPEKRDGELALWLDGEPVARFAPGVTRGPWTGMGFSLVDKGGAPFEGFRWRTTDDLKINFFWLMLYVTENAARQNHVPQPTTPNRVWFDDIVISTDYIGPIQARAGH